MNMELRYVPLRCTNLTRAREFYGETLGLAQTDVRPEEFVQYQLGGARLCVDLEHGSAPTPSAIMAVDDLGALAARLDAAGVPLDDGGVDAGWLQVRDPDGNTLVFERG